MEKVFMKLAVTLSLLAAVSLSSSGASYGKGTRTDSDGHELVSLWKDYRQLQDEDRPDKEVEVLEKIMAQSEKRHIPWDFYDAWKKYRDAVLSRDWKQKEALDSAMAAAIAEFDEPVMTFAYKSGMSSGAGKTELFAYVTENADRLKKSLNPQFYRDIVEKDGRGLYGSGLPVSVKNGISSDYEYTLWYLFFRSGDALAGRVYDELSSALNAGSLNGKFLEYAGIPVLGTRDEMVRALQQFTDRYEDDPVSLFARQALLVTRFHDLEKDRNAGSEDFKTLRRDCADFEQMRKKCRDRAVAGDCMAVERLVKTLDSSGIWISGEGDTLEISLRNVSRFNLEISRRSEDKVLYSDSMENPVGSFYRKDTVRFVFPVLDDGEYVLKCFTDEVQTAVTYRQFSISIAGRADEKGIAVYAADMESGKPLEGADVAIYKGDSLVCVFNGLDFNGFIPLDMEFQKDGYPDFSYKAECSFTDADGILRKSVRMDIGNSYRYNYFPDDSSVRCKVLKDRGMFTAGDSVSFKAVLYGEESGHAVMPEGREVEVYLCSMHNMEKIDSLSLRTNSFGSVAGVFHIPEGYRNGQYSIEVFHKGYIVGSESFVVGEIDVPTFNLVFDSCDTLYFPGDSITVGGQVRNYSGHSMEGVRAEWTVSCRGRSDVGGSLALDSEGRFCVGFRDSTETDGSSYYNIRVRVTGDTGETYDFNESLYVSSRFSIGAEFLNPAEGLLTPVEYTGYEPMHGYDYGIMEGDEVRLRYTVRNSSYEDVASRSVDWSVWCGDGRKMSGTVKSGEELCIDFSGMPSGLYRVEAEVSAVMQNSAGRDTAVVARHTYSIARAAEGDTSIDFSAKNIFKVVDGNDIMLEMGTSEGPLWAVAELWGGHLFSPLARDLVYVGGEKGRPGSLVTLEYAYKDSYPDAVRLSVFYFKDGESCSYSAEYRRHKTESVLPLEFTSFTDKVTAGEDVTVGFRSDPGSESAVSVYDTATDNIWDNVWYPVAGWSSVPQMYVSAYCGHKGKGYVITKGDRISPAVNGMLLPRAKESVSDGAIPFQFASGTAYPDMQVRDKFDNTLAFIPFLYPDPDGSVRFSFSTSGKTSTYAVSVFSHDRNMKNGVLRGQLTVTKPVMVSVSSPRFLREGDIYVLDASVSNSTDEDVTGTLDLFVYDTADYSDAVPLMVNSIPLCARAGKRASGDFVINVPEGSDTLGLKVIYRGVPDIGGKDGSWSDGLFVSVPVFPDTQVLTETHSAVLLPGMDADSLKKELSGRYVNTLPYGAVSREISLLDMVKESIPHKAKVSGKDAVSVSDALYVRMLTGAAYGAGVDSLVTELSGCQDKDGGFAWFKGMESSPSITALLLERAAEICRRTHVRVFTAEQESGALAYLDNAVYRGAAYLPLPEYIYVRSMYPSVPLSAPGPGSPEDAIKKLRKAVKSYFREPTGSGMFDGRLVDKARRVSASLCLLGGGRSQLSESLGLKPSFLRKIAGMVESDIASICGYAVEHESGGRYFPNAVMPFRGLLDSELYAHSLICDVLKGYALWRSGDASENPLPALASRVADGVRLWMMIQKETQNWEDDPAYVRAMASVLDGSEAVLASRIMVMSKQYEKPYGLIKASGNGFTVSRGFFREAKSPCGLPVGISLGDTLKVGDRVVCRYTITNSENRSFVKLSVPHFASLRPVDQISGMTGWWPGFRRFPTAPAAYRNVLADRTEYYFNVLPEGDTVIEEEFFVTRSGAYTAPVIEVECRYAPHYRANGAACSFPVIQNIL
jgi:hypothetical protein